MNSVTVELESGPFECTFAYRAEGDPRYSDQPPTGPWFDTRSEAEGYGFRLLAVGNWRSFSVEKRYFADRTP